MLDSSCKGKLRRDAKSAGPLCFALVSHTKVKLNCIRRNRADGPTPPLSVEQHTGLAWADCTPEDKHGVSWTP